MPDIDRSPPQNIEAEMSTLGCMLLDDAARRTVLSKLTADDFYQPGHKEAFRAIQAMQDNGQAVDVVTVVEKLLALDKLDAIGGAVYLTRLADSVPTVLHADRYTQIVTEKAILRQAIMKAQELVNGCYNSGERGDLLGSVRGLSELLQPPIDTLYDRHASLGKALLVLEERDAEKEHVPVGLIAVDKLLGGGMLPGEILTIGGRPGHGKTALALWILRENLRRGRRCLFISYEMREIPLIHRMFSQHIGIPTWKFRRGRRALTSEDWKKVTEWCGQSVDLPFFVLDKRVPATEIESLLRRYEPQVVFLDSLQHMPRPLSQKPNIFFEWWMTELDFLVKEAGAVAVTVSHVPKLRDRRRPCLDDLKDSAAIAQMSHAVILLSRENDEDTGAVKTQFQVAKNREGATTESMDEGWVEIYFDGPTLSFGSLETRENRIREETEQDDDGQTRDSRYPDSE